MFYGSCAAACPALIGELDRVIGDKDVRVLLVSFDPERDTPARLRELARAHHLDARWTLATAGAADVRSLAAVLGVHFKRLPDGELGETSVVLVLDEAGRPIARMTGLGDHAALAAAL